METYAVIQTGGKQYRVKANDKLSVERLDCEVGEQFKLAPVLAISDGEALQIGTPELESATVSSTVIEHIRGDKVIAYKQKRRKGYSRKKGHRQELTVIRIDSIG